MQLRVTKARNQTSVPRTSGIDWVWAALLEVRACILPVWWVQAPWLWDPSVMSASGFHRSGLGEKCRGGRWVYREHTGKQGDISTDFRVCVYIIITTVDKKKRTLKRAAGESLALIEKVELQGEHDTKTPEHPSPARNHRGQLVSMLTFGWCFRLN